MTLQELTSQTRKLSWIRVSVEMLQLGMLFPITFNYKYRIIRPMEHVLALQFDKIRKHLSDFPAVTVWGLS